MKEAQKVDALDRGHPGADACAPGSGVMGTCVGAILLQLERGRARKRPKERGRGGCAPEQSCVLYSEPSTRPLLNKGAMCGIVLTWKFFCAHCSDDPQSHKDQ